MAKCDQLTARQRDSLVAASVFLDLAEAGKAFKIPSDGTFLFDMNIVQRGPYPGEDCGTAGCILGLSRFLERLHKRPETWAVENYQACNNLFYPGLESGHAYDYRRCTPKMAADAIRLFLDGEDDPFSKIEASRKFRRPY